MGLVDLVPYAASLIGGGGVAVLCTWLGKWLIERERTKQKQCHKEHETMRRAIELTFPRQQVAMSSDQDKPTTA